MVRVRARARARVRVRVGVGVGVWVRVRVRVSCVPSPTYSSLWSAARVRRAGHGKCSTSTESAGRSLVSRAAAITLGTRTSTTLPAGSTAPPRRCSERRKRQP